MTPDRIQDVIKVKQEYNMGDIFNTLGISLDPSLACTEFIDNALDTKPEKRRLSMLIDFYPLDGRIVIVNEGTTGMPPEQMQEYVRFGNFGRVRKLAEQKMHGFGGKMAALWWLDKEKSAFSIFSTPPDSKESYKMNISNWHASLRSKEPVEWDVKPMPTTIPKPNGYTRMELENVNGDRIVSTKLQLIKVAEDLGLVYGPYIEAGLVEINLRVIKGTETGITVQPRLIRFDEKAKTQTTKAGGVNFDITWGTMIPQEKRQKELLNIAKNYGLKDTKNLSPIRGHGVHIYHFGRFFDFLPLRFFKIPGYRKRFAYDGFAIKINVVGGESVDRSLYKTGWAPTDQRAIHVYRRVAQIVARDIKAISEDADKTRIRPTHRKRIENTTKVVNHALHNLFGSGKNIAKEFGLLDRPLKSMHLKTLPKKQESKMPAGLPGVTHGSRGEKRSYPEKQLSSFLPRFELVSFGDSGELEAMITRVENVNVVELNLDNISVNSAINAQRNIDSVMFLARIILEALLAHKYNGVLRWDEYQPELNSHMDEVKYLLETEYVQA